MFRIRVGDCADNLCENFIQLQLVIKLGLIVIPNEIWQKKKSTMQ